MRQSYVRSTFNLVIAAVFFFVPWWLRPDFMPRPPYFMGFLITIPVLLTIILWVALGLLGLHAALRDSRIWWIGGFAALIAWALLSPLWTDHPDVAGETALQFAVVALFAVALACARPSARLIAHALATGALFQSVIVIAQVALQHPVGLSDTLGEFAIRPNNVGLALLAAGADRLMRPYGLTIHPNVVGGYFTVALLGMTGWLTDTGLARWRWIVRLGTMGVVLWALLLTFSRSAWGGLIIGLVVIVVGWRRKGAIRLSRQRVMLILTGAAVLAVVFSLTYARFVLARTATGSEGTEERSIADRRFFIGIAQQISSENPVAGVGMGVFPWVANDIINAGPYRGWLGGENVHNIALLALSELGIIGFSLWYFTILSGLASAWQVARDPFETGLAAGVIALLAIGLLDHYPWSIFHYQLLLWGGMGAAVYRSRTAVVQN
ncbi:MAG: O-antigen ligase family protein [Anaerolineae bacterium]|nr:O-antigen ligase family protein [Anaerolineae bacterium]